MKSPRVVFHAAGSALIVLLCAGAAHAQSLAPAPKGADVQTVGGATSVVSPSPGGVAPKPAVRVTAGPAGALATCTYSSPVAGQSYALSSSGLIASILGTRMGSTWMIAAVSGVFGEDWDLEVFRTSAAAPDCVIDLIASSSYGGAAVDFVLFDGAANPHNDVYARHTRYSGASDGRAQWRLAAGTLQVNDFDVTRSWGADSIANVWAVTLTAGVTYTLGFSPGAVPGATLHVFRNPAAGPFWAPRAAALATYSGPGEFTAPATGVYAFVIANDGHDMGEYSISVGACTPLALGSGGLGAMPRRQATWDFGTTGQRWAVFAAERGAIELYSSLSGGYPQCASGPLANFTSASSAPSFLVGNLGAVPAAHVYARTVVAAPGASVGVMWDGGLEQLVADGPPVRRSFDAAHRQFAEAWGLHMEAGQSYQFYQDGQGTSYTVYVFADPGTGSHWFLPSQAVAVGAQPFTYTAPTTGEYGVVVISTAYQSGGHYTLGVSKAPCTNPGKLQARTPTPLTSPDQWMRISPVTSTWEAFAVRGGDASDDWDISLSADPSGQGAPVCIGTPLAQSAQAAGLVDVIALQMASTPLDYHFVHAHHTSAGGTAGVAEFDSTRGTLVVNAPLTDATMAATTLVHSYSVALVAGAPYTIDFLPGAAGHRLLVFQNPGTTRHAVSRAGAVASTSASMDFVPAASGLYGLVVVNDAGVAGNYQLRVRSCFSTAATLAPGGVYQPASAISYYGLRPTQARWTAVGVRSSTADWDLAISSEVGAQYPDCIGPPLATSASQPLGRMDFVVGDFHHAPLAEHWVRASQATSGALRAAQVEWAPATIPILVNAGGGTPIETNVNGPLNVFESRLEAGKTYTISMTHLGDCNLHLLFFRNPGDGAWWSGRSGALFDLPITVGTTTYTPPVTDDYALVVVNEDTRTDFFTVSVSLCSSPMALASGVSAVTTQTAYYSFVPAAADWGAVGAYGKSNWDLEVYRDGSGGAPGLCFANLLASSTDGSQLDFVLGDFHAGANALGTYFARIYQNTAVSQPATVEFAMSSGELAPQTGGYTGSIGGSDVIKVWNLDLEADRDYSLMLMHYYRSDVRALLFRNPGGAYWVPRSSRLWETTTHKTWRSGPAGRYALVLVNDSGFEGWYSVGVNLAGVAVDGDAPPSRSSLDAVSPNPARGPLTVQYALHAPAMVRIELLDLSGRRVATIEEGAREAGRWNAAWSSARGGAGAVAPGLYCLRLQADGRTVGEKKVVIVR